MVRIACQKPICETNDLNKDFATTTVCALSQSSQNEACSANQSALGQIQYPLHSNGAKMSINDANSTPTKQPHHDPALAPGSVSASDEFITISLSPIGVNCFGQRLIEPSESDSNKTSATSKPDAEQATTLSMTTAPISHKCTSFQLQQQIQKPNLWVSRVTLNSCRDDLVGKANCSVANEITKNSLESINSKQSDRSVLISSDLSLASSLAATEMTPNNNNNKTSTFKKQQQIDSDCNIAPMSSEPELADINNNTNGRVGQDVIKCNPEFIAKSKVDCKLSMENVLNPSLLQSNVSSGEKSPLGNSGDQVRFGGFDDEHEEKNNDKSNKLDQRTDVRFKIASESRRPSSAAQRRASMCRTKPPFPFAGIIAAMLSSVFFSLSSLMIKLLPDSDEGEGLQEKLKAMLTRGGIITIICATTICLTGSTFKVRRDEIWVNFARAMVGSMGVMSLFCALEYISLGDATALMFSSPIWTYLLSHFIFAEPLHWILVFLLPLGVAGIILISHPTLIVPIEHLSLNHPDSSFIEQGASIAAAALAETPMQIPTTPLLQTNDSLNLVNSLLYNATAAAAAAAATTTTSNYLEASEQQLASASAADHLSERWPGIVISLAGSVFVSITYIVLKFRKSTPIQTTTFWFGLGQMSVSIIAMCFIGFGQVPKTCLEWTLLIANGVLSWLGQCVLQWSFAYEDAGVLSIVRTGDVAVCFLLSALFLEDDIYWTSIVGSLILGIVVALIIVNNWIYKSCHPNEDAHLIYTSDDLTPTKSLPTKHDLQKEVNS